MGVAEQHIKVSDTPFAMTDYYGKQYGEEVTVSVSKESTGSYTDTGFEHREDGTYQIHRDDGRKMQQWEDKLTQNYSAVQVEESVKKMGFSLKKEWTVGTQLRLNFARWR
jgi:two-component sensor histidine kinase